MKINKILIGFLAITLFGCDTSETFESHNQNNEKKIVLEKSNLNQSILIGETIKSKDGILYFHNTSNKNENNFSDVISMKLINKKQNIVLENVLKEPITINYQKNYIEITKKKTSTKILFVIANEDGHNFVHQLTERQKENYAEIIFGNELAYLKNHDFNLKNISENHIKNSISIISQALNQKGSGSGGCTSGGPGSSSCSVGDFYSSCSVSCSVTYYACCNGDSNTCYCMVIQQ